MSNYPKKESEHATGIDTFDLTVKKDFIAFKAKVEKLDIINLINVPTSFNSLKTKVNNLDVAKLKTVSIDIIILSDVVDNEVVKNTRFNTLQTKVNKLEN